MAERLDPLIVSCQGFVILCHGVETAGTCILALFEFDTVTNEDRRSSTAERRLWPQAANVTFKGPGLQPP